MLGTSLKVEVHLFLTAFQGESDADIAVMIIVASILTAEAEVQKVEVSIISSHLSHMFKFLLGPLLFFSLLLHIGLVLTNPTNVTIDDQFGDQNSGRLPVYGGDPEDGWTENGGEAQPDKSQAHDGTWHDATYHPVDSAVKSITIDFVGTAVYAYFITANSIQPFITTLTNLSFQLDDAHPVGFEHQPDPSKTGFDYNVLAYSQAGLVNTAHTLVVETTPFNASLVLFDYVLYT